jgi:hypothetical protein
MRWTAIKITPHDHGICPANGQPCDCVNAEHTVAVTEERVTSTGTDSSRYLSAGAARSFLVRTRTENLAETMPWVQRELERSGNAIIESNSIMRFLKPDVYLAVIDPTVEDFKISARNFLDRVDAVLTPESALESLMWQDVSFKPIAGVQRFAMRPPVYVMAEVIEFLKRHFDTRSVAL